MSQNNNSEKDYFLNLTPGKLSGLRGVADSKGRFKVLALDQSNSFRKFLKNLFEKTENPKEPTYENIRDAKLEITKVLAGLSSAVLLDVNYGARQALNSGVLPKGVGLIVRSEVSREAGLTGEMEPGWGIEKIKRMGGTAVKLLAYFDVEDSQATQHQIQFVEQVSNECKKFDILLMIEELSYPRKGETKQDESYKKRLPSNIFKSAELLNPYADILKLEFPGDIQSDSSKVIKEYLATLNKIAKRPWVLLSAGVKFELFVKQVELAMKAGCSGTMAGRAIFQEYFDFSSASKRKQFLLTVGIKRMKKLNALVDKYAQPWMKRYGITDQALGSVVKPDWYLPGEAALNGVAGPAVTKGDY